MASFSLPTMLTLSPPSDDDDGGSILTLNANNSKIIQHIQQDLVEKKLESITFDRDDTTGTCTVTLGLNQNKGQWGCPHHANTIVRDGCDNKKSDSNDNTISDGMKKLISLIVDHSTISKFSQLSVPDSIASYFGKALVNCKHLKTLQMTHYGSEEKRNMICQVLEGSSNLEELDLAKSRFSGEEEGDNTMDLLAQSLANGLKKNKSLRTLNLQGCNLSDAASAMIVNSLLAHPCIQHLNLSRNNCASTTMTEIGTMLQGPHCSLKLLDLSNQQCNAALDIMPIVETLTINTSLKELDISKNKITSSSVAALFDEVFGENTSLQTLSLGRLSVVASNNNKEARVADEEITDKESSSSDAEHVSACMEGTVRGEIKTIALKSLDLSGNFIRTDALSALADALTNQGTNIEYLNLDSCGITDEGIRSFSSRLPRMERLATLELSFNDFGAAGAKSLLEDGLRQNMSLLSLDFFDSPEGGGVCCLPPKAYFAYTPSVSEFLPEIKFYLSLNKAGRKLLRGEPCHVGEGFWAIVLEHALKHKEMGVGAVYCLLQGILH